MQRIIVKWTTAQIKLLQETYEEQGANGYWKKMLKGEVPRRTRHSIYTMAKQLGLKATSYYRESDKNHIKIKGKTPPKALKAKLFTIKKST